MYIMYVCMYLFICMCVSIFKAIFSLNIVYISKVVSKLVNNGREGKTGTVFKYISIHLNKIEASVCNFYFT